MWFKSRRCGFLSVSPIRLTSFQLQECRVGEGFLYLEKTQWSGIFTMTIFLSKETKERVEPNRTRSPIFTNPQKRMGRTKWQQGMRIFSFGCLPSSPLYWPTDELRGHFVSFPRPTDFSAVHLPLGLVLTFLCHFSSPIPAFSQ